MNALLVLSVSLSCLGLMTLSLFLMKNFFLTLQEKTHHNQNLTLIQILEQNRDLMNRMMSKDLPAYATMTYAQSSQNGTLPDSEYVSMSDEAEAQRIADSAGVGIPVYDDEYEQTIMELTGFDVSRRE